MKEIPDEQWWLLFFFESVAAIHSQAKGSFILELIARKRYQKLRELSPRLVRDLTDFDIRKRMEAGFVSDARQILDDPLPCRREIIDDYLPFKVKLGGWEIPVGFRALIDLNKESLSVNILVRSEDYREPLKRALLERMANEIAKQTLSHLYIPIRSTNWKMLEIKNSSGKVIPISGYQK